MAILRKQKTGNFTTVNNYFINDPNLKPDGKGFLLFMLSKPDDWKFNFINFQKSLGIGQKAVRSLVNKLEQLKYLKRERIRDEFGHYEWNYFVYEEPYDLVLKRENTPYSPSGYVEQGYAVEGNIYQNTNITNTESNKDKIENIDKTYFIKHKALINELFRYEYINEDDEQLPLYDSLFNKLISDGYTYTDIYSSIHYIIPKVMARNLIDEEGKEITNKFGYFKTSITSNFRKLNSYNEELYPEDDNSSFWDDYKFIDYEGR